MNVTASSVFCHIYLFIHHTTDMSIFMHQTSWNNNYFLSTFKNTKIVVRSLLIVSSLNLFLCRKRKCKRMALDPDAPSTSTPPGPPTNPSTLPMAKPTVSITSTSLSSASSNSRKKKVLRPSVDSENRCVGFFHPVRCSITLQQVQFVFLTCRLNASSCRKK